METLFLCVLAFFLPPLAVGLKAARVGDAWIVGHVSISLALTLLTCWLGGFIHALWYLGSAKPCD